MMLVGPRQLRPYRGCEFFEEFFTGITMIDEHDGAVDQLARPSNKSDSKFGPAKINRKG